MLPCSRLVLVLPAMRRREKQNPLDTVRIEGVARGGSPSRGTTRLRRLLRTLLAQLREHVAGFFDGVGISGFVVGD
jgi:hypothetical protein